MNTETKGKAIIEFEKIIVNISKTEYDRGEKDGRKNGVEEYTQGLERDFEKYATEYTVLQFSDCKTLPAFRIN